MQRTDCALTRLVQKFFRAERNAWEHSMGRRAFGAIDSMATMTHLLVVYCAVGVAIVSEVTGSALL
jgi:hypothetical protein